MADSMTPAITGTNILDYATILKASGDASKIKDAHLDVRMEWQRLYNIEKTEKQRPGITGGVFHLDTRERKLYMDGNTIDSWNLQGLDPPRRVNDLIISWNVNGICQIRET